MNCRPHLDIEQLQTVEMTLTPWVSLETGLGVPVPAELLREAEGV